MGFDTQHKIQFEKPKTFAVRADVDDLAKHLLRLLQDDLLREKMGLKGREHVVKNFDYHKVSLDMANTIEKKFNL